MLWNLAPGVRVSDPQIATVRTGLTPQYVQWMYNRISNVRTRALAVTERFTPGGFRIELAPAKQGWGDPSRGIHECRSHMCLRRIYAYVWKSFLTDS
jgi:hypothetical protein